VTLSAVCFWPAKELEDINLQLSWWKIDIDLNNAKSARNFDLLRELANDKARLNEQLGGRGLNGWSSIEEVCQAVGTMITRLETTLGELLDGNNQEHYNHAEECHKACLALLKRTESMGLAIPFREESVKGKGESNGPETSASQPGSQSTDATGEAIGQVRYVGVIKHLQGFVPDANRSCRDYLSDLIPIMPGVTQMDFIADESAIVAADRLNHLPAGTIRLSDDQAFAIAMYSYDLGLNSQNDGKDNFFEALNALLRERDGEKIRVMRPYLHHLWQGLEALPPFQGVVLRGIPKEHLPLIQSKYQAGCGIHWSSFTSTTISMQTAKGFAKAGGVIFKIRVANGRSIFEYSTIQREHEILLSPNSRFVVFAECSLAQDGYYYLEMAQLVEGAQYVF
jgi:hypothetical protein